MSGYAVTHVDDIPELRAQDEVPMRPVRHHFGISSFGATAWVAENAGDRLINEHEEDSGSEELYVVVRGNATFELDGKKTDAPAGTLVYVESGVKRTAFAEEGGTTIFAVGATRGEAYRPVGWELWYPLRKRYEAGGENKQVADELREIVAANPQYPLLRYNLACLDSLNGRTDEALDNLAQSVAMSSQLREFAKSDSDLDPIRDEPAFKEIFAEAEAPAAS